MKSSKCKFIGPDGQCPNQPAEDGEFCVQHSLKAKANKYSLTHPALNKSKDRHDAASAIKDMREEITLTRALIETRLNMVRNDGEMIASMGCLHQFIGTVEKLISSCHRMDTNLGNLLNKGQLIALAQDFVNIVLEELGPGHEEVIDRISLRLVEALGENV